MEKHFPMCPLNCTEGRSCELRDWKAAEKMKSSARSLERTSTMQEPLRSTIRLTPTASILQWNRELPLYLQSER